LKLISDKYSIDDIELAMDMVAEEIACREDTAGPILLYEWLEAQLKARHRRQRTMDSVTARLARMRAA
jgi:hypothetical protein